MTECQESSRRWLLFLKKFWLLYGGDKLEGKQVESRGQEDQRKQEDQATANSGDSWEEGHGKIKVEKGVVGAESGRGIRAEPSWTLDLQGLASCCPHV